MHSSLTLKTNLTLMSIWATGSAVLLFMSQGQPALSVLIGAGGGIFTGLFQTQALRSNAQSFIEAESALDVRSAMSASRSGKFALLVQWATVLSILGVFLFEGGDQYAGLLGSVALFFLTRDSMSVPGVFHLQRKHRNSSP